MLRFVKYSIHNSDAAFAVFPSRNELSAFPRANHVISKPAPKLIACKKLHSCFALVAMTSTSQRSTYHDVLSSIPPSTHAKAFWQEKELSSNKINKYDRIRNDMNKGGLRQSVWPHTLTHSHTRQTHRHTSTHLPWASAFSERREPHRDLCTPAADSAFESLRIRAERSEEEEEEEERARERLIGRSYWHWRCLSSSNGAPRKSNESI